MDNLKQRLLSASTTLRQTFRVGNLVAPVISTAIIVAGGLFYLETMAIPKIRAEKASTMTAREQRRAQREADRSAARAALKEEKKKKKKVDVPI
jgi:hypothetical protein